MAPAARHGRPAENDRLLKTEAARQDSNAATGAHGRQPLGEVDAAAQQPELAQLPAVQALRRVWAAQCLEQGGRMRLGSAAGLPRSAAQICSPYDPGACCSYKPDTPSVGCKA